MWIYARRLLALNAENSDVNTTLKSVWVVDSGRSVDECCFFSWQTTEQQVKRRCHALVWSRFLNRYFQKEGQEGQEEGDGLVGILGDIRWK